MDLQIKEKNVAFSKAKHFSKMTTSVNTDSSLEWLRWSFSHGVTDRKHQDLEPDNVISCGTVHPMVLRGRALKARLQLPVNGV